MRKPFRGLGPAVALAVLFTSCIFLENPEGEPGWRNFPDRGGRTPESEARPAPRSGSEFRRTLDFAPGQTLSLENDYGDVLITGWDRDEVEVLARGASLSPALQRSARESRTSGVVPEIEIREVSDGLLVRTPTFEGRGEAPAVSYEIRVPHSVVLTGIRLSQGNLTIADVFGRIDVSVDQGDLSVSNFSGPLRANVGTGNADVEVLDLREGDEVSVTDRRGDIFLRLERGAGAIVEANAPRGGVTSDFDLGVELPAKTVKGWIGQGGPSIILMATEGRIRILRSTGGGDPAAPANLER